MDEETEHRESLAPVSVFVCCFIVIAIIVGVMSIVLIAPLAA